MRATAIDTVQRAQLIHMGRAWTVKGLTPLVIKGASLSCTHYPESWMRSRDDIDVWVREEEFAAIRDVLLAEGYAPDTHATGVAVHQYQFFRIVSGVRVQFDVHLRVFNPALFAEALAFDEVLPHAEPCEALGGLRSPCAADALFLACVHRVAHHDDAPDLLWLYDIHLLARGLRGDEWRRFPAHAQRQRMREVCMSSLRRAAGYFATPIPHAVSAALESDGSEPSAAFLGGGSRWVDVQWSNFRHAASWRERAMLVGEHLFPSRDYMRRKYGLGTAWLPWLYVRRILTGLPRWFARSRRT